MTFDEREILELLLMELDLFKKHGAVGLSPLLRSLFQDSVMERVAGPRAQQVRPCEECQPFNLVSPVDGVDDIPCRHTFMMEGEGQSENAENISAVPGFERIVTNWLRARVIELSRTDH